MRSVLNQSVKTNVILCTSTPSEYISALCEKYSVPLYVNTGDHGITQDWNFAYAHADTDLVTITHQDDVYDSHYAETLLSCIEKVKKPIIFFSDYSELRNGRIVHNNKLLIIKRIFLLPLRVHRFWNSRFVRRRVISLGSVICCPTVTIVRENCPEVIFSNELKSNEDWQAWERLSRLQGAFVYSTKVLVYHRIHENSATSAIIHDNARHKEDYFMYRKFWPEPIARFLTKVSGISEKSNNLK